MTADAGTIVLGADGSLASRDAVRWAWKQAELTGSNLEAVTSWEFPNQYGAEFVGEEQDGEKIATRIHDEALGEVNPHRRVQITRTVTDGHPAQALTDASEGAELLVVGSGGHGGFARMLLGSVSHHATAHAHCPVVVVLHRDIDLSEVAPPQPPHGAAPSAAADQV